MKVAGRAREWFEGTRNAEGRELFEVEWDNIRAALDHAEGSADDENADKIVRAGFWYSWYGLREEHRVWVDRRAAAGRAEPEVIGAAALWALVSGEFDRAETTARRAISEADSPEAPATVIAWYALVMGLWFAGRRDEARDAELLARRAATASDDVFSAAAVVANTRVAAALTPASASELTVQATAMVRDLANPTIEGPIATYAGMAALAAGHRDQAAAHWQRAIKLARSAQNRMCEGVALALVAVHSPWTDDIETTQRFRDAIERLHTLHLHGHVLWAITGLASGWAQQGTIETAATILGFLDQHDPGGNETTIALRTQAAETVDAHPDTAQWRAKGAAMTRDEIVTWCLQHLNAH